MFFELDENSIVTGVYEQPQYKGQQKTDNAVEVGQRYVSGAFVENVTIEETVIRYRAAVGRHIDQQAQAFGFDSIVTAASYADEPADPLNQSYGQALRAWRSKCWVKCRAVLDEWQSGGLEPSIEDVLSQLPKFTANES